MIHGWPSWQALTIAKPRPDISCRFHFGSSNGQLGVCLSIELAHMLFGQEIETRRRCRVCLWVCVCLYVQGVTGKQQRLSASSMSFSKCVCFLNPWDTFKETHKQANFPSHHPPPSIRGENNITFLSENSSLENFGTQRFRISHTPKTAAPAIAYVHTCSGREGWHHDRITWLEIVLTIFEQMFLPPTHTCWQEPHWCCRVLVLI